MFSRPTGNEYHHGVPEHGARKLFILLSIAEDGVDPFSKVLKLFLCLFRFLVQLYHTAAFIVLPFEPELTPSLVLPGPVDYGALVLRSAFELHSFHAYFVRFSVVHHEHDGILYGGP